MEFRVKTELPSARLFIDCGVEKYRVGDFELALTCFDRAISFEPTNAEAQGRRGATHNRLNQRADARKDLLTAGRLDVKAQPR